MGIKKINNFLLQKHPLIFRQLKCIKLVNKIIAIDTNNIMYKMMKDAVKNNYKYQNKDGNDIIHIYCILNIIKDCYKFRLKPLFVFDGESPDLKKNKIIERQNNRNNAIKLLEQIKNYDSTDSDDSFDYERYKIKEIMNDPNKLEEIKINSVHFNTSKIKDIKYILDKLKLPYIQSTGEADKVCGYLNKIKKVDYVLSHDYDIFCFGGDKLLFNLFSENENINELTLDSILFLFNINKEQFIDFCILLGTDYNYGIKQDFTLLLNLIKKYKSIEKIGKKHIPFSFKYINVRNYFIDFNDCKYIDDFNYELIKPNFEDLTDTLIKFKILNNYHVEFLNSFIHSKLY